MAPTRVSGAVVAATSSGTTQSITLPTLLAGDLILIAHCFNPTSGTTAAPAGYTQAITLDQGTTMRLVLWTKTAVSGDSGATLTLTNTVTQRLATCVEVYRGVSGVQVSASHAETSSVTSHANATVVTTGSSIGVSFFAERSSTPSTTVSAPAGWTRWNQAFGTGSGACSIAAADDLTGGVHASGATVGTGNWVTDVANSNVIMFTLALATSAPVIDAGATQTVAAGSPVTLTGTDISVGTVTSRAWTQTGGPTVSLSGASTATATFTPSVADVYTFQYAVTDGSGTGYATTQVNVTTTTPRPVAVISAGSWTNSGSAASLPAALADEDPTTYALSGGNPAGDYVEVRLAPAAAGQIGVFYDIDVDTSSPAVALLVELRQGSTVIASWNETPTTSIISQTRALSSGQVAGITNRADLRLRFTATTAS